MSSAIVKIKDKYYEIVFRVSPETTKLRKKFTECLDPEVKTKLMKSYENSVQEDQLLYRVSYQEL
jgi:hypothetical protein